MRTIIVTMLAFIICSGGGISADPGRWEQTISGEGWELRLDKEAEWIEDELFVSPPGVSALPVNPPSCGWDAFPKTAAKSALSSLSVFVRILWPIRI